MNLLWTDFINSNWHDWRDKGSHQDGFDDSKWIKKFLDTWKLDAPIPLKPEELKALMCLRESLQTMVHTLVAGKPLQDAALEELNLLLQKGPVVRQITKTNEGEKINLLPFHSDWCQVMAEIAASFAGILAEGESSRIRICDNPDCLWVFFDDTRNHSKRFCDDQLCGNLIRVRRFRAQQENT